MDKYSHMHIKFRISLQLKGKLINIYVKYKTSLIRRTKSCINQGIPWSYDLGILFVLSEVEEEFVWED